MSDDNIAGRPIRAYDSEGNFRDFSTDEVVGRKLNYFKGWSCGAGVENIQINMDGDVYAATCRVGGKLGNVFTDEELKSPVKWLKCTLDSCSCGADLFIPKAEGARAIPLLKKTMSVASFIGERKPELNRIVATERNHAPGLKQVYWEIGRRCNFNCSYCWPWIHNNHERHKTLDELIFATRRIEKSFMRGSKVNFIISGGEPTINPAFMDWMKYLNLSGHYMSCHSNGSRLPEYYRELIHLTDLNLSLHFEFCNIDKFLKVVEAVAQEKAANGNHGTGHLEVKIMMAPGRREQALEVERRLREIPDFRPWCTWAIVPIRVGNTGEQVHREYQPADFEMFGDRV